MLTTHTHAQSPVPPPEASPTPLTPSAYDARDDIFYQIMPISWRYGTPTSAAPTLAADHRFGNFQGMTDSLPYLRSLGITGVWMTPIFPSPAYHGYQHGPADTVNPWFGPESDFWSFIEAARTDKVKVYLDFVIYGLNQDTPQFKSAKDAPDSPFNASFAWTDAARTKPYGYTFRTWNGESVRFAHFDLRNPAPRALVTTWARHWLDPNDDGNPSDGIAGFRLDHVWSVYAPDKRTAPGGWGYNIDPFWLHWKRELQQLKPDVFTFAEQAKWETWGTDLMPAHDATFSKPFEFAAREALRTERADKLYEWMGKAVAACPKGRTFLATLGDHDVDRLSSAIGADTAATEGRARAAAAVLLLQPFPPILYYGDEIGMLGKAGSFGSDSNDIPRREPMKWLAVEGPPMTRYHELDPRTVAKQYSKDHDGRSVQEQEGASASLLETYRDLIKLRHAHIALRRGDYQPVPTANPAVWKFRRAHQDETLEVTINLAGKAVQVADGSPLPAYSYRVTPVDMH